MLILLLIITTSATTAAGTVVFIPCLLGSVILKAVLNGSTHYPYFIDKETEAQER